MNNEDKTFPNNIKKAWASIAGVLGFFFLVLNIYEKHILISDFFQFSGQMGILFLDGFLVGNILILPGSIFWGGIQLWKNRKRINKELSFPIFAYWAMLTIAPPVFALLSTTFGTPPEKSYQPVFLMHIESPIIWGNLYWLVVGLGIIYCFWYYSDSGKKERKRNFYHKICFDDDRRDKNILYKTKINAFLFPKSVEYLNIVISEAEIAFITHLYNIRWPHQKTSVTFNEEIYRDTDIEFLEFWDEVLAGQHLEIDD